MSITLLTGDAIAMLGTLDAGSVDACVTDPPYHLTQASRGGSPRKNNPDTPFGRHHIGERGFMGKVWDGGDMAHRPEVWAEVLRVLKPGAHLVAFGGTRTHHRLMCAIEDAGFEIRDTLMWLHGQGFPKGKGQLKPAWEPIILARKLLTGSVAQNVLEHGTGALNVDGCRIGTTRDVPASPAKLSERDKGTGYGFGLRDETAPNFNPNVGRWPANVVLSHEPPDEHGNGGCREVGTKRVKSNERPNCNGKPYVGPGGHATYGDYADAPYTVRRADADGLETVTAWACEPQCAVRLLDEQSGTLGNAYRPNRVTGQRVTEGSKYGDGLGDRLGATFNDTGGASRFFATFPADQIDSTKHICDNQAWENADRSQSIRAESDTQTVRDTTDSVSGIQQPRAANKRLCTATSGSKPTDQSQTDSRSIIETTTSRTTDSKTSSLSTLSPTSESTADANSGTASGGSPVASAETSSLWTPSTGTYPPRDGPSTDDAVLAISAESLPINAPGATRFLYYSKASSRERGAFNTHPTVKPLDLMRWLVTLVTPPGGLVLDCFAGSGSTLVAADRLGFDCIGIDSDPHAIDIARRRLTEDAGLFADITEAIS